jgi:hypothetical protein
MEKKPDRTALTAQLRTIPFLETLSPEAHRKLAETARWYTYETGAVIFWEGERPAGLYLVEYGWVRAYKCAANGREQVLHYAQAGETFNEIGAFASWQNPVTAVALEETGIWILQKENLLDLLHRHPEFAQHIINKMGERVMSDVRLGGSWVSVTAVHLGAVFLWISIFATPVQGLLHGSAYLCWGIAMLPFFVELFQITRTGLQRLERQQTSRVA